MTIHDKSEHITSDGFCQVEKVKKGEGTPVPCQNHSCSHHVFFDEIFLPPQHNRWGGGRYTKFTPKENDVSRGFFNCMCFLDRELSAVEIADLYGVTSRSIELYLKKAIQKLKGRVSSRKDLEEGKINAAT